MAKLKHPITGTVVEVEGRLAEKYQALGWEEDKPKRTRRSSKATDEE